MSVATLTLIPQTEAHLTMWENLKLAIQQTYSVDEVKQIRDKAQAMQAYLKQVDESLELQNRMADIKNRAQRRIGELLEETELNKGAQGSGSNQYEVRSHDVTAPTLNEMGISKIQSSRWQKAAKVPEVIYETYVDRQNKQKSEVTSADVERIADAYIQAPPPVQEYAKKRRITSPAILSTVSTLYKNGAETATEILASDHIYDPVKETNIPVTDDFEAEILEARENIIRVHKSEARKQRIYQAQSLPDEYLNVVYADPPWQYSNSGLNGAAEKHYDTMPTPDICKLLEEYQFTGKVAKNAVLFMWVTNSHVPDALKVMEAWGFTYKANFVWEKDKSAYGNLAFYNKGQHELLFVGTKGTMTPFIPNDQLPTSILRTAKSEHSRKPEETYELIETLYPGCNYLELFARRQEPRSSWTFWGDEANGTD
jgi:N6-adenosine-specific RNA methylase IME4